MINTNVNPIEIVFLDIETVRGAESLVKMPKDSVYAWIALCKNMKENEGIKEPELFKRDAALYPEFGKIVCISVGYFDSPDSFKVKAFVNDNEKELLQEIVQVMPKIFLKKKYYCGHNIKNFDFPYIIRRSVVCGVHLPTNFNIYNIKPWDLNYILDTMEIWKSGAYSLGSCSLQSICAALGLGNPKENLSGDMVSTIYYNMNDSKRLEKIGNYCNEDTVSCAKVFLRLSKNDVNFKVTNII
jgi:DNA polymerase elongation subunit (family B)